MIPSAEVLADGQRRCGRCRGSFPLDPTLFEPGAPSWWLCDDCRVVLITSPRSPRTATREA